MGLNFTWERKRGVFVLEKRIWQATLTARVMQDIRTGLWGGMCYFTVHLKLSTVKSFKQRIPFAYRKREHAQLHGERWIMPKMR